MKMLDKHVQDPCAVLILFVKVSSRPMQSQKVHRMHRSWNSVTCYPLN